MLLAGQFRTAADQRYTVLELPYLGRSLSLQVVLPSERKTPLSSLESQLTARQLASWDTGLRRTKMDIFLPRFTPVHLSQRLLAFLSAERGLMLKPQSVCCSQVQNAQQVQPEVGASCHGHQ